MKRYFENKNFRLLFFGNLLSGVGQGMTVIGAPWYLARHYPAAQVLGSVMVVTTIASLVFSPYAGALIDRHKRRTVLLAENVVGFAGLGAAALVGVFGSYSLWTIAAVYLFTILIFNVHFPAMYALVQESFPREWYGGISGMLEVLTQTAAIAAGGLTGMILETVGVPVVFAIDAVTYALAFAMLLQFRYDARVGVVRTSPAFWSEIRMAGRYLRSRPHFTLSTIALLSPFIVLIGMDLVHPFYVQRTLRAPAHVYSLIEGFYAAGATAAGFWMRRFSGIVGDHRAYVANFVLFIVALALLASLPLMPVAFAAMVGVGWANAGVRVNRITYVLHEVPVPLIGRVNMILNWVGLAVRALLFVAIIWITDALDPQWGYALGGAVLLCALVVYMVQQRAAAAEHASA